MGTTIIVVASGPSLHQDQVRKARESGLPILVINDNYKLVPDADYLFAADLKWWYKNYYDVPQSILCYTLAQHPSHIEKRLREANKRLLGVDYTTNLDEVDMVTWRLVHHGSNSGYIGIQLAAKLGYHKIILIGFDHKHTGGKRHWFGDHDKKWFNKNADHIEKWVDNAYDLFYNMKHQGYEVVNCTASTNLVHHCRLSTLDEELNLCLSEKEPE